MARLLNLTRGFFRDFDDDDFGNDEATYHNYGDEALVDCYYTMTHGHEIDHAGNNVDHGGVSVVTSAGQSSHGHSRSGGDGASGRGTCAQEPPVESSTTPQREYLPLKLMLRPLPVRSAGSLHGAFAIPEDMKSYWHLLPK